MDRISSARDDLPSAVAVNKKAFLDLQKNGWKLTWAKKKPERSYGGSLSNFGSDIGVFMLEPSTGKYSYLIAVRKKFNTLGDAVKEFVKITGVAIDENWAFEEYEDHDEIEYYYGMNVLNDDGKPVLSFTGDDLALFLNEENATACNKIESKIKKCLQSKACKQ